MTNNVHRKRKILWLCAILLLGYCAYLILRPWSTTSVVTLNIIQKIYYEERANRGDINGIVKLCFHYSLGETPDINKAEFWLQRLSEDESYKNEKLILLFRSQIDLLKYRANHALQPTPLDASEEVKAQGGAAEL